MWRPIAVTLDCFDLFCANFQQSKFTEFTRRANSELKSGTSYSGKVFKLIYKFPAAHSAECVVKFMQCSLVEKFSKKE